MSISIANRKLDDDKTSALKKDKINSKSM